MNFEYFIAKRLIKGKEHKSSISTPIIKIAIFAIAVGMIMMLITVATGVGLQRKIREKVAAFNGHILISSFDNNSSVESLMPISTDQNFYPEFSEVEGIVHMQGVATKMGLIRTASDFDGVVVKGVGKDYNWDSFKEYLVEGRIPDFTGELNEEILLSSHIANRLGFSIGDKVITYFLKKNTASNSKTFIRAFEIVGIYNSGFLEFDETFLFADIRHVIKMNKWKPDEIGNFEVFIDDFDQIDKKGQEIYENIPSTLDSQTISLKYATIFEWLKLFDLNIIGIIGIIILVAGINMITALLVLILERTPMIGILKALGTNDWSIRKVFLYNAAYLILIGLFWGNLIGIGLLLIQEYYGVVGLNPETYYVSTAPVYIDIGYIVLLNIGTMLLCLLMLLIPSYIIAKISPTKSIRFQ
ncbi:lipoprotein-releasing system permease protein [Aquimarina sp. EL_43]|uniref:ABC transporter permease n=1 Tax=Aquimarina TaxID=290174 RepID=UPI000471C126|nr:MULTISPECIES: FtsX-like permease family protein [Aquimarina]MBG6128670.1 lipoprotein-releasing system permease protein [Aquimarina sp. EL_35]MBG6149733.1 lipoprotein-releasing system permease protein [Aquimarina sp. EL_32]MBG6167581.1 lipoprotein-releasing system permease protein [Aquimarina sp. EL_43]